MGQILAQIEVEATAEVIPAATVAALHRSGDHQYCAHAQRQDDHETEVTE